MEIEDMRRRVAAARVARLATLSAQGRPHLVPFCFVLTGDVLYSVVDDKKKVSPRLRRLDNIRRDPRATVLVDHYEEDWERLWWVSLSGSARELEGGGEERERALELLSGKYEQYARMHPSGPVLRIDVERWSGWSAW
jgi:PPOX class probable F420-dependent enzyme